MANINVNGTPHQIDVEGNTPASLGLAGGGRTDRNEIRLRPSPSCGACTVHVNGEAIRSCSGHDR